MSRCNGTRLNINYNIAQAAYLVVKEGDRSNDRIYIAFGRSNATSPSHADEAAGSGVCSYSMANVRKEFTSVQKTCFRGRGKTLAWINGSSAKCVFNVSSFRFSSLVSFTVQAICCLFRAHAFARSVKVMTSFWEQDSSI